MDILNTGKRIRYFRILNGMTQKALGMAAGFPEKSADVRIAQYETGTRKPKHDVIVSLANVFNVSPMVLERFQVSRTVQNCVIYCLHWRTNLELSCIHSRVTILKKSVSR